MDNYSVLMSVYYKEKPDHLNESIRSIYEQTVQTNDFVLVCDGPLTEELNAVISGWGKSFGGKMHVFRLKENHGLGFALNAGIKRCKNELVARMDSDDIAVSDRCYRQLKVFEEHPETDVVSGTVSEFNMVPGDLNTKRIVPESDADILAFAKKRNPFNHPCVMYKKSRVTEAGGYKQFYLLEDYYLWVRMLLKGAKGHNIQEPLLYMRVGNGMYKRRSGIKHARSQIRLFRYMHSKGFISSAELIKASCIRTAASLIPNGLRKAGYRMFLR